MFVVVYEGGVEFDVFDEFVGVVVFGLERREYDVFCFLVVYFYC